MLSCSTIDRLRNSLWSGSRLSTFVNSQQNGPSHIRLFELQRSEMRADELVDRELLLNLQSVSSCRLVMFLRVMHYELTCRIYKNGAQQPASGALLPGIEASISMLQCKIPPFSAKSFHLSVNLPIVTYTYPDSNVKNLRTGVYCTTILNQ